jgi:hypothetical protein
MKDPAKGVDKGEGCCFHLQYFISSAVEEHD